jgi:hypothetical protein
MKDPETGVGYVVRGRRAYLLGMAMSPSQPERAKFQEMVKARMPKVVEVDDKRGRTLEEIVAASFLVGTEDVDMSSIVSLPESVKDAMVVEARRMEESDDRDISDVRLLQPGAAGASQNGNAQGGTNGWSQAADPGGSGPSQGGGPGPS